MEMKGTLVALVGIVAAMLLLAVISSVGSI